MDSLLAKIAVISGIVAAAAMILRYVSRVEDSLAGSPSRPAQWTPPEERNSGYGWIGIMAVAGIAYLTGYFVQGLVLIAILNWVVPAVKTAIMSSLGRGFLPAVTSASICTFIVCVACIILY